MNVMEPSTVPYIAVYSAAMKPPETPLEVHGADVRLTFTTGPLTFVYSVPLKSFGPGRVAVTLGERQVTLPRGSYIVIETIANLAEESERERLALRVAEVSSLVALRHSHVLDERLFEGVVNTTDRALMWREGPMTFTAAPAVSPKKVADGFASDFASVQHLDAERRQRLQLASRWFRRGHEAINQVDKYLFWWTVLEIYPGKGESNIVQNVTQVLRNRVCPHLEPQILKEELRIGRIYGERKRIVHDGRAFVAFDDAYFQDCLERLHAIATVSLRLLGGLPPGDDLKQYVEPGT